MKNKFNSLTFSLLFGLLFLFNGILYAQVAFPYDNSLMADYEYIGDEVKIVEPSSPGLQFSFDGLQLTNQDTYSNGTIVLDGVTFSSENGLTISFEYDMFGGQQADTDQTFGDGISLFLYDATVPLTDLISAPENKFGYLYDRRESSLKEGLNKAYLAIGLDLYGDFKTNNDQQSGIDNSFSFANFGRDYVTLRGAMRHEAIGLDENAGTSSSISDNSLIYNNPRFAGYPVLYTRGTNGLNGTSGIVGAYLDMTNNSANQVNYIPITEEPTFTLPIRNNIKNPDRNDFNFRRVFVNLTPADPSIGGGFFITVSITTGVNFVTLVDKYHYKEEFYYTENANSGSITQPKNHLIKARVPEQFKIGFMGTTSAATQFQYIRKLNITHAYVPQFSDDLVLFCRELIEDTLTKITIDVFKNDLIFNGPISDTLTSGTGPNNIDYESFEFILPSDHVNSFITEGNITTVDVNNSGVWTYDSSTGLVTFLPVPDFLGTAFIHYTAKGTASQGGPFDQENYRSSLTRIEVEVKDCNRNSNPQLPFNRSHHWYRFNPN